MRGEEVVPEQESNGNRSQLIPTALQTGKREHVLSK